MISFPTGMMRDDTREETAVVKEAIRRLPDDVYDKRMYRMTRALHLSGAKKILPKVEWMTLDKVGGAEEVGSGGGKTRSVGGVEWGGGGRIGET